MFRSFLIHNMKRRFYDGFSLGYHLIFPFLMIVILGLLTRKTYASEINSFQYYSIVLIPYCTVLGLVTAAYAGKDDAYSNTAARVLTSPVTVRTIVTAKILSCGIVLFACSMAAVLLSALIWKINILPEILPILLFYASLSFAVSAAGTMVGLALHNFLAFKNVISIPVSVFAALAGTFYPFRSSSPAVQTLIGCSPFTFINRSIFLAVYDHRRSGLIIASLVLFLVGILFAAGTKLKFKKEEYINGVIPDYEK